jgi:hypothetical protein
MTCRSIRWLYIISSSEDEMHGSCYDNVTAVVGITMGATVLITILSESVFGAKLDVSKFPRCWEMWLHCELLESRG